MKAILLCALAALALSAPVAAMTSPPTSAPAAYTPEQPRIQGTVVSVNDHALVVETDQGEQVHLVMDSRTLLPNELAIGTNMWAEFRVLENGSFYAKRVVPIRSESDAVRRLAYARTGNVDNYASNEANETERTDAYNADYRDNTRRAGTVVADNDDEQSVAKESAAEEAKESAADEAREEANERENRSALPESASPQPLVALLGALALMGGGLTLWARRSQRS